MTDPQRLFLAQARSDFAVFQLLRSNVALPACHALHYLQMATELLGKAHAWRQGQPVQSHRAFVGFLRSLTTNRVAQGLMGFDGRSDNWKHSIRKSIPLAEGIEALAPALALDTANPEYPWPRAAPEHAPAEFDFPIWENLRSAAGRQFLSFTEQLFGLADQFL